MPKYYELFLKRPENHPTVVQVFIWRVLVDKIFDRFRWAGRASKGFDTLWDNLFYKRSRDPKMTHTAIQKLHAWRATTTGLVCESLTDEDVAYDLCEKENIMYGIHTVLDPLFNETYDAELANLLDEAIKLDKVISSQAAMVSWKFNKPPSEKLPGKPALLNMEEMVVVCPAMIKRGKSNGEDFDDESVLLPRIEGFCKVGREREI
ncbi:hypothetical protein F4781DRAFT_64783 [Annulohypoxylon bovei var. microspora]|nr:hypothetical protein F4781DRAFT_64783 [Annulohypoxylon bovei var. microspora]